RTACIDVEPRVADLSEAASAPREVRAGQRGEPETQIENHVVVLVPTLRSAVLSEFHKVGLAPESIQQKAAITIKEDRLLGDASNATQLMDAVEQAIVRVIVVLHSHKLTGSQRDGVAELRSPRLLLTRRQNAAAALKPSLRSEGILTEIRRPEITHLKKIAHMDVFGCDPGHDGIIITRRASQMDVVIRGIPTSSRHVDPAF